VVPEASASAGPSGQQIQQSGKRNIDIESNFVDWIAEQAWR